MYHDIGEIQNRIDELESEQAHAATEYARETDAQINQLKIEKTFHPHR